MKKFATILLLLVLFSTSFIISFPKERLYALVQSELAQKNIQLASREIISTPFSLQLKENSVAYQNIKILNIAKIDFSLLETTFHEISPDGTFSSIIPNIKVIKLYLKPGKFLEVRSALANATGILDFKNKTITITVTPKNKEFSSYKRLLHKLRKKGNNYVYKYSF